MLRAQVSPRHSFCILPDMGVVTASLFQITRDLLDQGSRFHRSGSRSEAQQPSLELDGVAQLERGDDRILAVLDNLLAGMPLHLTNVRRRPAGEFDANLARLLRLKDAKRALKVTVQREIRRLLEALL